MKKYLTIIRAITLLITGTGVGFCEESKKPEIQNSQTLKEQVESNPLKGKIAKAMAGIIFFLQCLWDWVRFYVFGIISSIGLEHY
jgi:hypothetical protein